MTKTYAITMNGQILGTTTYTDKKVAQRKASEYRKIDRKYNTNRTVYKVVEVK